MTINHNRQSDLTSGILADFCSSLQAGLQLAGLMDHVPDVYLFIKDCESRFMHANRRLLEVLGMESNELLIGRSDHDFFSPDLAEQYIQEDIQVIESGRPILNEAQIVPRSDGVIHWYITSKLPIRGHDGQVVGVAGVMRDFQNTDSLHRPYQEIKKTVSYILRHYSEKVTSEELAELVHLSKSQFNRRFRTAFAMSPQQFVALVRIKAARQLLVSTDMSVTSIAQRTGFYDHSYFTKQFTRSTGLSPLAYRKKYTRHK